jgi:hydrogenase small subunit
MSVSRRNFLKYCGAASVALGLDPLQLGLLQEALADPTGPSVLWLHGSSCTGCSVSLLNRISENAGEPATVTNVLADAINLIYHPTLMASAGDTASAILQAAKTRGNFILVLEGGIPTAFNGACCIAYSLNGVEVTHQEVVSELAPHASHIICAGTCASFGGIPHAGENPTGVISASDLTGRPTINLSGCPTNPDWVVWAIVQLLLGNPVTLDENGRPEDLYAKDLAGATAPALIHDKCPRSGNSEATDFGAVGDKCLVQLGCRGPHTKARCNSCWNGIAGDANWCIGVNAPCHGCTEPDFPGPEPLYDVYRNGFS